ncbi:MAG: hypothetical protein A3G32_04730 [Deltaproteobacteria bacterium RIFCSPLOWO2_12_FULL_40_28]|nr:MAG: hypothetical protein A3C45_08840 [Deltaproteobacteria bacterium RIFCSPHIGHO2_02_FULL_40_28]OGQ19675.1 MAG: hypothetical protein A3E27_08035 [Deltaproteobacteria bacterium RIFCSPHIGHO2_12_FULL_40_32]OGQ40952.1 MAG: hypothetical protein A3I69_03450 [Deltaproteobacteria bacterium RIFCSPLOWO2_02_FULL_40_36]OGQ54067.1 MAG: hypothetical protein A3G32_04730 [Deltaproteobacteria bacterium RIFCSPLOWO2_12_FULL_40_28]
MALAMGMSLSFFGDPFTTQVKKETTHLISTIRYLYNEAAVKNSVRRLVLDIDNQQYWYEEGGEEYFIDQDIKEEKIFKQKEKKSQLEEEGEEVESSEFARGEEDVVKKVVLNKGVFLKEVYVSHQEGPLTAGQAYLYFFPHGQTEEALIVFTDEDRKKHFSIIINPITAHARVIPHEVEWDKLDEASEDQ